MFGGFNNRTARFIAAWRLRAVLLCPAEGVILENLLLIVLAALLYALERDSNRRNYLRSVGGAPKRRRNGDKELAARDSFFFCFDFFVSFSTCFSRLLSLVEGSSVIGIVQTACWTCCKI